jgi:hypothetical protein
VPEGWALLPILEGPSDMYVTMVGLDLAKQSSGYMALMRQATWS